MAINTEWTRDVFKTIAVTDKQKEAIEDELARLKLGDITARKAFIEEAYGILFVDTGKESDKKKFLAQLRKVNKRVEGLITVISELDDDVNDLIDSCCCVEDKSGNIFCTLEIFRNTLEIAVNGIKENDIRSPGRDREIISQLAKLYIKHFDKEPKPSRGTNFHTLVSCINDIVNLKIQCGDKLIQRVLENLDNS